MSVKKFSFINSGSRFFPYLQNTLKWSKGLYYNMCFKGDKPFEIRTHNCLLVLWYRPCTFKGSYTRFFYTLCTGGSCTGLYLRLMDVMVHDVHWNYKSRLMDYPRGVGVGGLERGRGGQTTAFMIPWPSLITPPDSWSLLYCLWYLHCCQRCVLIDGLFMESIFIEWDNLDELNVVLSDA